MVRVSFLCVHHITQADPGNRCPSLHFLPLPQAGLGPGHLPRDGQGHSSGATAVLVGTHLSPVFVLHRF